MSTPAPAPRVSRRYLGPLAAVLVVLPTGRTITVSRGSDVEVLAIEAMALDALPGWEPTPDPEPDATDSADNSKEN